MNDYNQRDRETGTPPDQDRQEQSRQYWSGQDARRAQGGGQPPPYGGSHPQQGYRRPYEPQGGPQNPYQYGAGWQQPPQDSRYQWSFEDYDKLTGDGPERGKGKHRGVIIFAVCLLCVLALSLVGLSAVSIYSAANRGGSQNQASGESVNWDRDYNDPPRAPASEAAQIELTSRPQTISDEQVSPEGRLTIPQVAQKLLPSVVSVETYINSQFYEAVSVGSGIIMNDAGYIITNQHVIEGADAIKVTLHSGDPYEARLIGADARTDLAVLRIEASDLVPAEFGNSNELLVGEKVIAIGNPGGLEYAGSVTLGIVSAVNRSVNTGVYTSNYIQTDAAINPGNSGGALVNEFGQVIGINSIKYVAANFEGMGFAIPISDAKPIIDDLIANGRVTGRVMLGITAVVVDEVDAKRYDVPMGLQIVSIDPNSDLNNRGVHVRDIITHVNGDRIYNHSDLRMHLDNFQVGQSIQLTLYRQTGLGQGQTYDVSMVLMEDGA